MHRLYGAYGEKKLYGKVYEGVIRSTFVIDGDGVIRVARIHPRYSNHERFLGILVQAGSHGGAHRAAKAAELVYCDVFDVVEVSGSDLLQAFHRPDRRQAGLGNGTKLVISIIAHARTKLFHSYRNIRYCARFGTRKIDRRATIQASRAHVRRV